MNTPKVESLPDSRIREEIAEMMAVTVKLSAEQARFNAEYVRATDRWWLPSVGIAIAFMTDAVLAAALLYGHQSLVSARTRSSSNARAGGRLSHA